MWSGRNECCSDPLRDIALLQRAERIKLVWKGGRMCVDRRVAREVAVEA